VLLLNSTLTVREGEAGSHAGHGWETFTDAIISYLGSRQRHIVFVLWGAHAGKKTSLIDQHHTVITSVHPSPLSAHRGFFGSRPFSRANRALSDHNQPEINWAIA
jgi:uracil-DNA glycosylase